MQAGQWRVWRRCRTVGLVQTAPGKPATATRCLRTRRSPAAPPALSIRPPLGPSPFCSPRRPVAIRAWRC